MSSSNPPFGDMPYSDHTQNFIKIEEYLGLPQPCGRFVMMLHGLYYMVLWFHGHYFLTYSSNCWCMYLCIYLYAFMYACKYV